VARARGVVEAGEVLRLQAPGGALDVVGVQRGRRGRGRRLRGAFLVALDVRGPQVAELAQRVVLRVAPNPPRLAHLVVLAPLGLGREAVRAAVLELQLPPPRRRPRCRHRRQRRHVTQLVGVCFGGGDAPVRVRQRSRRRRLQRSLRSFCPSA
ncbi:unnamed protein product, partial [Ectocarpus sp. 8 AP-2014]